MFNLIDFKFFDVGDEIEFETSSVGSKNFPRWDMNKDTGGSGIWATGKVVFTDDEIIQVEYDIEGYIGTGNCTWPNFTHRQFDFEQWELPGYLRKRSEEALKETKCGCGGDKLRLPHSDWCPKYVK